MRYIKQSAGLGLLALSCLFLPSPAFASYPNQLNFNASTTLLSPQGLEINLSATGTLSGDVQYIQLKMSGSGTTTLNITRMPFQSDICSAINTVQPNSPTGTPVTVTFELPSNCDGTNNTWFNFTRTPSGTQGFGFELESANNANTIWGSSVETPGLGCWNSGGNCTSGNMKNLYMEWLNPFTTSTASSTGNEEIGIYFPHSGTITSVDFSNFLLNVSGTNSQAIYTYTVYYSTSSPIVHTPQSGDYTATKTEQGGDGLFSLYKGINFESLFGNATTTVIYFRAFLYNANNVEVARGGITYLTWINANNSDDIPAYYPLPPELLNETSTISDCSAYTFGLFSSTTVPATLCAIENMVSRIFLKMFTPSTSSFAYFAEQLDMFNQLFPFNIFSTVNIIASSSISNVSINGIQGININEPLYLPLPNSNGTLNSTGTRQVELLSSSTLSNVLGTPAKEFLFNIQRIIMAFIALLIVITIIA